MKFVMSNGKFVCKDDAQNPIVLDALTGIIAGIRIIQTQNDGKKKLQIDLKDVAEDGETPVVRTLNLKLYGNPAFRLLRSLYGIAEILADKKITIASEEISGEDGTILRVYADGEQLPICGSILTDYTGELVMMTDQALMTLERTFGFRKDILVFANKDNFYPGAGDAMDVDAVCAYIRDLRRSGRSGELTVVKTAFTMPATAKGYLKALRDLSATRAFRYTDHPAAIQAIWDAYTGEIPENPAEGADPAAVEDEEC